MKFQANSHSRRNLLTGDWVLVSPHRTRRPWQGQIEETDDDKEAEYDPSCYLCPGNKRANDHCNPAYSGAFIFDNDFTALSPTSGIEPPSAPVFDARSESGICRVVCYTEKHNLRLSTMNIAEIETAISAIARECNELDKNDFIGYVQVFENRGQMMGCSNPHPHAQIWATEHLPNELSRELEHQLAWYEKSGSVLLADYRAAEIEDGGRMVCSNDHFISVVPYWAVWPFETMILPHRNFSSFNDMSASEVNGLADILKSTLSIYDRLFDVPAPYSMGFHPRPSDGNPHPEWIFHGHVFPPLLRSATIRKHLVGFEMLAMPQRDLTPEAAAEQLRNFAE